MDGVVRPGMDLSKIALPTFVLEPRSLLERITDFFSHPELIFGWLPRRGERVGIGELMVWVVVLGMSRIRRRGS